MFYFSLFNPASSPGMVWAFVQPVSQCLIDDTEPKQNLSLINNYLSGSFCQDSKEQCSPTPRSSQSHTCVESCYKLNVKQDKNKKIKQKNQQQEFKPNMPELKKTRKTPQNANRNVVPNIMHQVISFLQKKNKSEKLVQKLIKANGIQNICSVKRFYYYQLLIKQKLNHYVNAESLTVLKELQQPQCQVYSEQEQRHYNKISRLLVQYFLTREFDTIILTSKRVNSNKKLDHLATKRKILQQFSEMFVD